MRDLPRWRFRISTLMLVVVVLALTFTLISDRWKREQELRRLEASETKALAAALARFQSQYPP